MKKSIAILSMALLAGNAFAADVLEAGTEEAPKYYVIKANRGIPYVTYTADKLDNGGAETNLYRSNELSEAAVWAVVPGTEDGTVNIYNYTTKDEKRKAYMFTYITKSGEEFAGATGAVATTASANDVYVKNYGDGSYGLSIVNENGFESNGEGGYLWYGLDATNNSEFLGNWWCANDDGSKWWFFAVDVNNVEASLEAIEYAALKQEMDAKVTLCSNEMASYAAAVPWVAEDINAGIAALAALEVSADYSAQVDAIRSEYIGKANASLNTMFVGKEVALKNLRKNKFLGILDEALKGVEDSFTDNSIFILEGTTYDDGTDEIPSYYIYNAAAQKYISSDRTLVDSQDDAASVTLMLQTGYDSNGANGLVGMVIRANGVDGNNAYNLNNANPPGLDYWKASGADSNGSIWSVVAADEASIVEYVTSASIETLQAYVTKVPEMVANVLNAGIAEIKALTASEDLAEKAQEIVKNTLENANNLLNTGINGLQQTIYYPRGNRYLSFSTETADWTPAATNYTDSEVFTFKAVEGGVILFNEANNIYVGKAVQEEGGGQYNVLAATEESEAQVFTVELNNNSGFYGVSFVFDEEVYNEETEETTTRQRALNMNMNAKCLHTYGKADGGSIFCLENKGVEDSISEISVAPAAKGIYDLAGRKLAAPVKGINIINGVKVLVK